MTDKEKKEPISEDLEAAIECCGGNNGSGARVRTGFIMGAKWQKEHLWKSADGDDLPEIDREVIALEGIVDPTATDCLCGYKVVFAHRPTQEGYDGKSIATGIVEHYTPKTYGEGGWNIPNIVYWLDVELPKEMILLMATHQAEKDLELSWEDIKTIDKLLNQCVDCNNPYQEVLKRFKERKEK